MKDFSPVRAILGLAAAIALTFFINLLIGLFGIPNSIVTVLAAVFITLVIGRAIYVNEIKSKKNKSSDSVKK
jgi:ABC-type sulfate transport system permease subunit